MLVQGGQVGAQFQLGFGGAWTGDPRATLRRLSAGQEKLQYSSFFWLVKKHDPERMGVFAVLNCVGRVVGDEVPGLTSRLRAAEHE